MSDLPLSKTLDPADFAALTEELAIVDRHFTSAREQHPMRRWEYAMALRAFEQWGGSSTHDCIDVGGAGSPFWRMLPVDNVTIVDPDEDQKTLADYLRSNPRPRLSPAVFCLSVLEHVDDLDQFLYHLSCLVAPGGLLFLTMDCCGCGSSRETGPQGHRPERDRHHFHWMRKRIFRVADWAALIHTYHLFPTFDLLGPSDDWRYHGDHVYDYAFASLALVKRS